MSAPHFNAAQDRRDEQDELRRDLAGNHDHGALARRLALAEMECPHGYIGAGPCPCYELYRVGER